MSSSDCKLCRKRSAIEKSHIIPAFVFRLLKSDSPTGFMRNPNDPNRRQQDGAKLPLLCEACEKLFSAAEGQFAKQILTPFHTDDVDTFEYGPWLHYFLASLAWRTLILDLPGLVSRFGENSSAIVELNRAEGNLRQYLLGATHLSSRIRLHAVPWAVSHIASPDLANICINSLLRRSAFGYSAIHTSGQFAGVAHNLLGFMCFFLAKGKPADVWSNTKISPKGGSLSQPQRVSSWIMGDILSNFREFGSQESELSERQRKVIENAVKSNLSARGIRFMILDHNLRSGQFDEDSM